ncbi:class I SAM-dependent methyltransferase [Salinarimonas soli]|uniref:Class I SAM-dependent methyltransferase n=1 Tax=Salinarimonas soli TaxID=1638099 RepID=A0A5B2VSI3_9HYPH|nr:class I SAM-dependent methyltransferase [Salinarimonas soli]KAA2241177.1 class I SAM-dependent methyltransferase [Salinarimonas soli]
MPLGPACPVCTAPAARGFLHVAARDYWRCERCLATFLDPAQRPPPGAERDHYLTHRNDPDDEGYRAFLSRLAAPLLERLEPGRDGLDYGCGPGPALAAMLSEAGHRMSLFDPFFAPDEAVLGRTYDFVTCTEVAEHFHDPAAEFERLARLLHPGGWLAVMTCFQTDDERFARWRYRADPTHVVFYREATLRLVAERFGLTCEVPVKDVALMRKPV